MLKKFLVVFLLSIVFIPQPFAETFTTSVTGVGSSYYKSNSQFVSNYNFNNQGSITVPVGQYFKFNSVKMVQSNILSCDGSTYIYRVDYTLWGWHNQNKTAQEWQEYAQNITLMPETYTFLKPTLLGSIINIENGYKVKISSFVSYETLNKDDCSSGLKFDLVLHVKFGDTADDKFFFDSRDGTEQSTSLYYTIDNLYTLSSKEQAQILINQYYSGQQITQEKLDDISNSINGVTDKINETNQNIKDLESKLSDSDVSGANTDASNFFNNFNTKNHGGISSIVTSPLVAINKMLETSCTPLSTTYKGKTIEMPCGNDFWKSLGPVKTFLNMIEGGLICYAIITALYKDIDRMKNPDDDRVDVMKL